jgi:hypothetical protein
MTTTPYTFHQDDENIASIIRLAEQHDAARFIADLTITLPCFPGADYDKSLLWEYISTDIDGAREYYNRLTDEEALSEAALALDAGLWTAALIDAILTRTAN